MCNLAEQIRAKRDSGVARILAAPCSPSGMRVVVHFYTQAQRRLDPTTRLRWSRALWVIS